MNERIKLLAKQAGTYFGGGTTDHFGDYLPPYVSITDLDLEKFAELIVQECADIINHRADTCSDWLDSVKANEAVREGQRECAKTIKEHFGVDK
jgi:hypothetical protein